MDDGRRPVLVATDECFELGLRAGAIIFEGVRIGDSPPDLRTRTEAVAANLRRRFTDLGAMRASKEMNAFMRIYRASGVSLNRERPGCDRLAEFAWKRGNLPRVNNLVDAYNMVSIEWLLSLGAHDLHQVALPIRLERAREDRAFIPLGASREAVVKAGEFAYVDAGDRVVCRLDVIQAAFSKITTKTSNAVAIVEGTKWHSQATFEGARSQLVEAIHEYCGGSATVAAWPF